MELLDNEGDFTDRCREVLTEVFQRFDKDSDGALNDEELDQFSTVSYFVDIFVNFVKACNGKPFDKDSKEEIKTYFKLDKNGNLTLNGFMEMYHMQTSSEPKETWRDLQKLGYNKKLEKVQ